MHANSFIADGHRSAWKSNRKLKDSFRINLFGGWRLLLFNNKWELLNFPYSCNAFLMDFEFKIVVQCTNALSKSNVAYYNARRLNSAVLLDLNYIFFFNYIYICFFFFTWFSDTVDVFFYNFEVIVRKFVRFSLIMLLRGCI